PCATWGGGTELPDGEYKIRINAWDKAGNLKAYAHNFILDTTAPLVEITNPDDNSLPNGNVELRATVEDDNLHHYWLNIKKNGSNYNISGVTGTKNTNTSFTDKLLTTLTEEGKYKITLAARDSAGGAQVPVIEVQM